MKMLIRALLHFACLLSVIGCKAKDQSDTDWERLNTELSALLADGSLGEVQGRLNTHPLISKLDSDSPMIREMICLGDKPVLQLAAYSRIEPSSTLKMNSALSIIATSTRPANPMLAAVHGDLVVWSETNKHFPVLLARLLESASLKEENLAFLLCAIHPKAIAEIYRSNLLGAVRPSRESWLWECLHESGQMTRDEKLRSQVTARASESKNVPGRPRLVYTITFATPSEREILLPCVLQDPAVDEIGLSVICNAFANEVGAILANKDTVLSQQRREAVVRILQGIDKAGKDRQKQIDERKRSQSSNPAK